MQIIVSNECYCCKEQILLTKSFIACYAELKLYVWGTFSEKISSETTTTEKFQQLLCEGLQSSETLWPPCNTQQIQDFNLTLFLILTSND